MMKKVRRVLALVAGVFFTALGLAGCALFERDVAHYNDLIVASVGADVNITKKDLINAFNSWGYRYASEYSMTTEEALEETIKNLVDREIIVVLSKQKFGGDLSAQELADVCKSSYESMDKTIKSLQDKIREEWKLANKIVEAITVSDDATGGVTHDAYTEYEKQLEHKPFEYNYEYQVKNSATGEMMTVTREGTADFTMNLSRYKNEEGIKPVNTILSNKEYLEQENKKYIEEVAFAGRAPDGNANEDLIAAHARNRLIMLLRNSEKGLTFPEDKNATESQQEFNVINRELERIQKEETKNMLVKRFHDCFDLGLSNAEDYNNIYLTRGEDFTEFSNSVNIKNIDKVDDLVKNAKEDYERKVLLAVDRFNKGLDTVESIGQKVLSGLSGVYFVPQKVTEEYFTVSHILLGYSDEQTALLNQYKNDLKSGRINTSEYETRIQQLQGELRVRECDENGHEIGNPRSAEDIMLTVRNEVDAQKSTGERIKKFQELIYRFNSDPGMINAEFEYVIGTENSQMVESFTNASRDLFSTKKPGSMTGLVWSDFGVHIIMYTRNLDDFIFSNPANMLKGELDKYIFATQTSYGNKTAFDTILESLQKPAYDNYERDLATTYKNQNGGVTTFKGNYKDLLKKK